MAFYGNITNTSQTTFQFDRIYSNRLEMDVACANDSIFVGRYVLVEYDKETAFPVAYKDENGKFYSSKPGTSEASEIRFLSGQRPTPSYPYTTQNGIYKDEIIQVQETKTDSATNIETVIGVTFYKCTGGNSLGKALFSEVIKTNSGNNYINNFSIDESNYTSKSKNFGGYDSTVWVKTTVNLGSQLSTKYVQIAELNSVVPTFDVAADAPTMEPLPPHFDADSTNIYYKLHLQSPYGFRVKENTNRSDETTTHYTTTYDIKTGKTTTTPVPNIKADIFYNKAAFEYKPKDTSNRVATAPTDDTIKIEPTGRSKDFNSKYNHTTNTGDIQEMTINLPTVGYMVSKGWDVIHGENRDDARTDVNDSLQGRLDSFKDMYKNQIPVKREPDGTFVGTNINGGNNRIVTNIMEETLRIDDKERDDAWIKTNINTTKLTNKNEKNNGISIHHTFTKGVNTTTSANKNDGTIGDGINKGKDDVLKLYTPIVDAAGHVVAKNIETVILPYGYKTIKTDEGLTSEATEDIYTTIKPGTTTVSESDTKTGKSSNTVANNTQDILLVTPQNKWIQVQLSDDELKLAHEIHGIDTIAQTTNKNIDNIISNSDSDKITVQDLEFDRAGHVIKNQSHTYTLPYGFKTVKVENSSDTKNAVSTISANGQSADSTQDTLTLSASNIWIKLSDVNDDTIKIGHTTSNLAAGTHASDDTVISEFGDSFNILNFTTDAAGHVTGYGQTTIKIPVGTFTAPSIYKTTSDIMCDLTYDPKSGNISYNKTNTNTLNLSNYEADTGTLKITQNGSINSAFKTIANYINDLDLPENQSTTQFISSIKQEDGKVTVSRANAGTLVLGTTTTDNTVSKTDSLNAAFNKVEARIKAEEENRVAAIDALDYTDSDPNSDTFVSKVNQENGKIEVIHSTNIGKLLVGDTSKKATETLNSLKDRVDILTAGASEKGSVAYQIAEIVNENNNDSIDTLKEIAAWIVNDDTGAASVANNVTTLMGNSSTSGSVDYKITQLTNKLGSAAYTDSTNYLTQTTTFNYGTETKTIQDLMNIVNQQATTIEELKNRIDVLENPTV